MVSSRQGYFHPCVGLFSSSSDGEVTGCSGRSPVVVDATVVVTTVEEVVMRRRGTRGTCAFAVPRLRDCLGPFVLESFKVLSVTAVPFPASSPPVARGC